MKKQPWLTQALSLMIVVSFSLQSSAQIEQMELDQTPDEVVNVIGSLYTDAASSPSIESVVSWGSYLYLCVRYVNGDQKLEVWDVRDPANPVQTDSLDYGNIMTTPTDHWKFPSVNAFDNMIVVRSNFADTVYHHDDEGKLVSLGSHDFANSVGNILNSEESIKMSSAESYGTFFGRLYDPYEVLPQEEYGHLILNFTNPNRPFVATLVPPKTPEVMQQEFGGHISGSIGNSPAVVSTDNNQISITARKVKAESQMDVFWEPRIPQIFHPGTLDRTVRAQIDRIVNAQPLTDRLSDAIESFFDDLEIEIERTVAESIEANFDLNADLEELLDHYGIDLDLSVKAAVQKVIEAQLTLELEKTISLEIFSPMISDWMDELFAIPTDLAPGDMKESISLIINDGLTANSVARYILDKYIAPYVDVPDWMYWTMDDLVDELANSTAGDIVTGAASVLKITAGGALETALALIPDADEYYLPAGFPGNCREVLEYAFFEHGAKLQRNGLAFLEMLKFYQYYQGNDGYLEYEVEFSEDIRALQEELSGAFVETITPFMSALSTLENIKDRIDKFSEEISCRAAITLAIRDSICFRLEQKGINIDLTVREALANYDLYADILDVAVNPGARLSSIADFVNVIIDDLQEGQTTIQTLWLEGVSNVRHLEVACRKALSEMLTEAWGDIDLDLDVYTAIREFIGNHIDYRWTFGESMDNLLYEYVNSSLAEYPPFIDELALAERAFDGDVIARWQLTFQMAATIAASNPATIEEAIELEIIEFAIDELYKQAMMHTIKALLLNFANIMLQDMYGSFSTWATRTESYEYTINTNDMVSITPVRSESFVWKDQVFLVARESWDYMNPRQISLAQFDPLAPEESLREVILDGWGNVDYIHFHRGNTMICGSMYDGFLIKPTSQLLTIDEEGVMSHKLHELGIASAEGLLGVNHDAHLVVYGPAGIYILNNPRREAPSDEEPDSSVETWAIY
jgi:hypothetical protein